MDENKQGDMNFSIEWLGNVLGNMEHTLSTETYVPLMKNCSDYHYRINSMDQILAKYVDDLDGFIHFLTNEWGWIISIDEQKDIIIADENKDFCVCPLTHSMGDGNVSKVLCHCSEGFAERMFSKILGKEVTATVIRSILRGDKSCAYQINI
jgi:predicted hydrocarbon binding protein